MSPRPHDDFIGWLMVGWVDRFDGLDIGVRTTHYCIKTGARAFAANTVMTFTDIDASPIQQYDTSEKIRNVFVIARFKNHRQPDRFKWNFPMYVFEGEAPNSRHGLVVYNYHKKAWLT
ncbi:MAG: hypothetical protein PHE55_22520 [Methylococcaceae bacterium]|nr:hypothetical protein [Methylococcaceae bacterium]